MCFCLLLLTGMNFIIYPLQENPHHTIAQTPTQQDEEESSAPVEEKSSSKTGVNIQEEYIHEFHSLKNIAAISYSSDYKISGDEKLQTVHFELDAPPPKA